MRLTVIAAGVDVIEATSLLRLAADRIEDLQLSGSLRVDGETVGEYILGETPVGEYTTEDYRNAPSGIGPLAYQWKDKPHRLVYDLCKKLEQRGSHT